MFHKNITLYLICSTKFELSKKITIILLSSIIILRKGRVNWRRDTATDRHGVRVDRRRSHRSVTRHASPRTLVRIQTSDASGMVWFKMHARRTAVPKMSGIGSTVRRPPCYGLRTGRGVAAGHGFGRVHSGRLGEGPPPVPPAVHRSLPNRLSGRFARNQSAAKCTCLSLARLRYRPRSTVIILSHDPHAFSRPSRSRHRCRLRRHVISA